MKFARMRTIKCLAVAAVAVASVAVPASAQGAVHHAANPYLFVYTEPVLEGCMSTGTCYKEAKPVIKPDEITFTLSDGTKATLDTHQGEELPLNYSGCSPGNPAKSCKFDGWIYWSGTTAIGANMFWAKVGKTMVANVTPPVVYNSGGFTQSRAGNWWFYCLEYTPYSAPNTPGPIVYLRYSFTGGWHQIKDPSAPNPQGTATICQTPPTLPKR
jgi:hypothetical protein